MLEDFKLAMEFEEIEQDYNLQQFVKHDVSILVDSISGLLYITRTKDELPENYNDLSIMFIRKEIFYSDKKPFFDRPTHEQWGLTSIGTVIRYDEKQSNLFFIISSGQPLEAEKTDTNYVNWFASNKFQLYSCRAALEKCKISGAFQKLTQLFDSNDDRETKCAFRQDKKFKNLNDLQRNAVLQILQKRKATTVVGPPGTGKTATFSEVVRQAIRCFPQTKILLCASSNSACNTIMEKLLAYPELSDKVYRIFSHKESSNLSSSMSNIYSRSNCHGMRMHHKLYYEEVLNFPIIVTTPVTSFRLYRANSNYFHKYFNMILVDESSQMTVPEFAILLAEFIDTNSEENFLGLFGDPKQLGPQVRNRTALQLSLDRSIMEFLTTQFPSKSIHLRLNYRSHQGIIDVYNGIFYDGRIVSKAAEVVANLNAAVNCPQIGTNEHPVRFFHVSGSNCERKYMSTSLQNYTEAVALLQFLKKVLDRGLNDYPVIPEEVGIITPYLAQVEFLKILGRELGVPIEKIEVGTPEKFQGEEKSIVLISTVKNNSSTIEFISDMRRIAVMLSRAQRLMCIFADAETLKKNDTWKDILSHAKTHEFLEPADQVIKCEFCRKATHIWWMCPLTLTKDDINSNSDEMSEAERGLYYI